MNTKGGKFADRERDNEGRIVWDESDFFDDEEDILQPGEADVVNDIDYVYQRATMIYKAELERTSEWRLQQCMKEYIARRLCYQYHTYTFIQSCKDASKAFSDCEENMKQYMQEKGQEWRRRQIAKYEPVVLEKIQRQQHHPSKE